MAYARLDARAQRSVIRRSQVDQDLYRFRNSAFAANRRFLCSNCHSKLGPWFTLLNQTIILACTRNDSVQHYSLRVGILVAKALAV